MSRFRGGIIILFIKLYKGFTSSLYTLSIITNSFGSVFPISGFTELTEFKDSLRLTVELPRTTP